MNIEQLYIFCSFLLTGFAIGILFDIFRILRRNFKTWDWIIYIQDFIFWILTGFILLFSIFTFNEGELRGYIFIAIILGIILYLLLLSKYFIWIATKIIIFFKKHVLYPIKACAIFLQKHIFLPFSNRIKEIHIKISKKKIKNDKNDKISQKNSIIRKDFWKKCRNK